MTTNGHDESRGRETRLLLLVVAIALGLLFVLARVRFPSAELNVATPAAAGPLQRLAARTAFDDLGSTIAELVDRLAPALVIVQLEPVPPASSGKNAPVAPSAPPRLAAAIRVRADLACLYMPSGYRVAMGDTAFASVAPVATDATRDLALVRVAAYDPGTTLPVMADAFPGFAYVAAIEAARGGPTAKPVFIGRVDPVADPHWQTGPLVIGGDSPLAAGTLLFALDGRFVGIAWPAGEAVTIVPAAAVNAAAMELAGSTPPLDSGPPPAAARGEKDAAKRGAAGGSR